VRTHWDSVTLNPPGGRPSHSIFEARVVAQEPDDFTMTRPDVFCEFLRIAGGQGTKPSPRAAERANGAGVNLIDARVA
jgi:hypothetical protein